MIRAQPLLGSGGDQSAWGQILYCELADVYSSAGTFLQFTNQDVPLPFHTFQKVQSQGYPCSELGIKD